MRDPHKYTNAQKIDEYIKEHPAVSGKKIREHFCLTEGQFWKATPHITASHGHFGRKFMYWHGKKPAAPFVFVDDEIRTHQILEQVKSMTKLTNWVGGNPFLRMIS